VKRLRGQGYATLPLARLLGLFLWTLLPLSMFAKPGAAGQSDAEARGHQIVTKGSAEGAPPCASCHAENGIADGSGAFPRLTGQFASYLNEQLNSFADGTRTNPVMSPIAKQLSDQERRDVAAYYSLQHGPFFPRPFVDQPVLELGGSLAAAGLPESAIPACFSCHGESGKGVAPNFPYLAGQYWSYLAAQLRDFRTGFRYNDPGGVMRLIASKLGEGDRQAVSAYLASIRPPCSCAEATPDAGRVHK
jgi:cytochrome c553